jgi:transcriptional regulator with XRE-family HTH domain
MRFGHTATLIRNERLANGWTQEDLAKLLGYKNSNNISGLERGRVTIHKDKIKLFADVFMIPYGHIILAMVEDYKEYLIQRTIIKTGENNEPRKIK